MVVPALLLSATFHEFAHGWMADRLGDSTARGMGRLTLNPIRHIDPFGSVILPVILALSNTGFFFAYAKPVPVNPYNLRDAKTGMAWVALAGPATNIIMAFSGSFFIRLLTYVPQSAMTNKIVEPIMIFLVYFVLINVILAIFNMIPVPPLDGGRIAVGVLPTKYAYKLASIEPYGMFIVLAIVFLGLWGLIIGPFVSIFMKIFSIIAGVYF